MKCKMKFSQRCKRKKKTIFIVSWIIVSSVPVFLSCYLFINISNKNTVNNIYTTMYSVGEKQNNILENSMDCIIEDLNLLAKIYSNNLEDEDKIYASIEFMKNNGENIFNEIYIVDKNLNLQYGYNFRKEDFSKKNYLKLALGGEVQVSQVIFEDKTPYFEICVPIFQDEKSIETIGVIVAKIDIGFLNEILEYGKVISGTVDIYIVDENGLFLTKSKYVKNAAGKERIDIRKLKLNIDYNNGNSYVNYAGNEVFGAYFELPYNNSTLVIEEKAGINDSIKEKIFSVGKYMTLIEIIVVALGQKILPEIVKIKDEINDLLDNDYSRTDKNDKPKNEK